MVSERQPCAFEGCHNLQRSSREPLCTPHYKQRLDGKPLTPLKFRKNHRIDDDGRECSVCKTYKRWHHFSPSNAGPNGYSSRCKDCSAKLWRENYGT